MGEDNPLCLSMGTCPRHIERFERQYDKAFAKDPLFRVDVMESNPQTCSGVFTLLQNNCHMGRGVGGPRGVRGVSEKGVERGVVDLNAKMGGSAISKGGGKP